MKEDVIHVKYVITARWLPSCCDQGQVVLLYRKIFRFRREIGRIYNIRVERNNIIIFIERQGEGRSSYSNILIRRISTFGIGTSIYGYTGTLASDCRNGLLVTASTLGYIE